MNVIVKSSKSDELRNVKPGECFVVAGTVYVRLDMSDISVDGESMALCYVANAQNGIVSAWAIGAMVTPVAATLEIS
jgi:hypothetical protein